MNEGGCARTAAPQPSTILIAKANVYLRPCVYKGEIVEELKQFIYLCVVCLQMTVNKVERLAIHNELFCVKNNYYNFDSTVDYSGRALANLAVLRKWTGSIGQLSHPSRIQTCSESFRCFFRPESEGSSGPLPSPTFLVRHPIAYSFRRGRKALMLPLGLQVSMHRGGHMPLVAHKLALENAKLKK
ncbi:hypothetical protein EVAR_9631_1 [Eumeta japonica]|uniref:Uncharacterized protein n=1 Tax=Eumeta variegata TaxID=151549 RepID=A0A4C1TMN8_EUMVA|nr:hypothetical protein EVAR_9631_1 [Eumeta japonica]